MMAGGMQRGMVWWLGAMQGDGCAPGGWAGHAHSFNTICPEPWGTGYKCLCSPAFHRWLCVYVGGVEAENRSCQFSHFQRSPPTCSKINMIRSVSCLLPTSCNHVVQTASPLRLLSLRVETQLSLALQACPGLSQLTSEAPGCNKSHLLQTHRIQPLWLLKPNVMGISIPM